MIQFATVVPPKSIGQSAIVLADEAITQTMAAKPNDASALFELYRISNDRDSFVSALILKLLIKAVRP